MADMVVVVRTESDRLTVGSGTNGRLQKAGERLGLALAQVQAFGARTRDRVEQAQRTNPFQVLAVIAGVALASGLATRVWRSSTNA